MFSMPDAIPIPPGDQSTATRRHSDTATIPYPIRLSITTPATSRVNGDWGFKRPLPLKSTIKQTFPLVRVHQMDSTEHITDYQSASDHTMTLKKFQELNMSVSVPSAQQNAKDLLARIPKSVFEEDSDITAMEPGEALAAENKRWKFKGPWLAGMTEGEFKRWLERDVRKRRAEFRAYLKEIRAKELTEERKAEAVQENLPEPPAVTPREITDEQYIDYLKDLRQDRLVLFRHVGRFLDLAPLSTETQYISTMKAYRVQEFDKENPYGSKGPPITHPSAGLSYLRTPNFLDNHPIYGPQKYHPVVKARILKPRSPNTGTHDPAIGIAGIIADRPMDQRLLGPASQLSPRGRALSQLELQGAGGAKVYYKLDSATIDSSGRIRLGISDPGNQVAELVVKEMLGEDDIKTEVYMNSMLTDTESNRNPNNSRPVYQKRPQVYGSQESYGLGGEQREPYR